MHSKKTQKYVGINTTPEARTKLKLLAAQAGESMASLIERLILEECIKKTKGASNVAEK